jgi:hypothetical protein
MRILLDKYFPKTCYYLFGVKIPFYLQYLLVGFVFYKPIAKVIKNKHFQLLLILIPAIIVFVRILRNDPFFLSDDFAHLSLVSQKSFGDIARMAFSEKGIWVGHRIITGFWLFKILFDIFGAEPVVLYFSSFIFHALNVLVLFLLLRQFDRKSVFPVLMSFVFSSFYLTWISNLHELVAGSFVLLATLFWIYWLKRDRQKYYFGFFAFYLIAIASKEISFLLAPTLVIFTLFNNLIKIKNYRRAIISFFPLLLIFVFYSLAFALGFSSYLDIGNKGYGMSLDLAVIVKNLTYYLSYIFRPLNFNSSALLMFFSLFIVFDLLKKKFTTTPFLVSFAMLLAPALLFVDRNAPYYVYIPSIFLFMALSFIFKEVYEYLIRIFRKTTAKKIFTIYYSLFILIGLFGMNKFFLDDCFLIQFPWKNQKKILLSKLTNRLDIIMEEGKLGNGDRIPLLAEEDTEEMRYIINSNVLQLFMQASGAEDYTFSYSEGGALEVRK